MKYFLTAVILIFLVLPSLRILYLIDENDKPFLTLKTIGHQWYWSYEYSDFLDVEFDTYMILVFSSKRKHLLMTLLSLEFIVLILFIILYYYVMMMSSELYITMFFLSFAVCEGALGLSILVSMIRTYTFAQSKYCGPSKTFSGQVSSVK